MLKDKKFEQCKVVDGHIGWLKCKKIEKVSDERREFFYIVEV